MRNGETAGEEGVQVRSQVWRGRPAFDLCKLGCMIGNGKTNVNENYSYAAGQVEGLPSFHPLKTFFEAPFCLG